MQYNEEYLRNFGPHKPLPIQTDNWLYAAAQAFFARSSELPDQA
jgi:hypothetical protein